MVSEDSQRAAEGRGGEFAVEFGILDTLRGHKGWLTPGEIHDRVGFIDLHPTTALACAYLASRGKIREANDHIRGKIYSDIEC